jgi:hypothetical protein
MKVSYKDQLACAKRELAMRRGVYPRWVENARLTQDKADKEIAAMEAIVETLERLDRSDQLL